MVLTIMSDVSVLLAELARRTAQMQVRL